MWPFPRKRTTNAKPDVIAGDITAAWNADFGWWEFTAEGIDFVFDANEFSLSLPFSLRPVFAWIRSLDAEIDRKIQQQLDGWSEWTGQKDLVTIDVSSLLNKNEVDVSYANDDWADLGINIIIRDGEITGLYVGD